jgi:hypothetical protein
MRCVGFAAVMVALNPLHALAQDYANATNAAWCAGALGAYATPGGVTYLDHARSRHLAVAQEFFGAGPDKGATMLIFENVGSGAAANCNQACAAQRGDAQAACFEASPDCKRIIACLTESRPDP